MGNRLSKIYTRTGDDGSTGMADGTRVSKSDLRFDAMGTVDMLNAQIGMIRCHIASEFDAALNRLQHQLFNIGGELAMPDFQAVSSQDVAQLEQQIDSWNSQLLPLKEFILPAGSALICHIHIARCQCRDAERVLVSLQQRDGNIHGATLQFINRLSDWLFVLVRIVAKTQGQAEVLWQKNTLSND
ncbi:MAG: cob(I)yrinic acid a,c-diamide adenosyltransferase [Moraxella sp.]|jgi:cob(I)alamin adenosyltransferase